MISTVFVKNGNDYILNTVWKNIKFSSLVTEGNEGILSLCVLLAEKEYQHPPKLIFQLAAIHYICIVATLII